ncbi:MAG: flagellar biosynthesis anti-sigma factor FlgM [Chloroflexi bacterium]|nr:flagellar biosynthesis anti-sigma factor FlgM [Chloroflexota bacterium]
MNSSMDISSSGATQSSTVRDSHRTQELDQAQRRVREGARRQSGADEAVISDKGQLLKKLGEAVRDSSDVRDEKVAELRAAIEHGRYQLSYAEIAKALLASRTK